MMLANCNQFIINYTLFIYPLMFWQSADRSFCISVHFFLVNSYLHTKCTGSIQFDSKKKLLSSLPLIGYQLNYVFILFQLKYPLFAIT